MCDVRCPYCGIEQNIDHDDGSYGYKEDETYQQECQGCENTFAYTTSISFCYEAAQAPCMNGSDHVWKITESDYSYLNRADGKNTLCTLRCMWCDEEKMEWV